jgi:hypothetical protein
MTMITYQESERSRFRPSPLVSFIRPAALTVLRLRDAWRRRQTEKVLEGLPSEIRKDIGWPTTNAAPGRR